MVPLYGLGKTHPFSQVGEGCARNRLDYCDHSPPWPGALGQGKKKGLDSPSTDFPKTSHKKQKQNKKTQTKQQQQYSYSSSLMSSLLQKVVQVYPHLQNTHIHTS